MLQHHGASLSKQHIVSVIVMAPTTDSIVTGIMTVRCQSGQLLWLTHAWAEATKQIVS